MITVNLTEYERRILIGYLLHLKRRIFLDSADDVLKIEHLLAIFKNSKKEE